MNTARRSTTRHGADPGSIWQRTEVAGVIHVGGPERLSRFELMQRAARALGIDPGLVRRQPAGGWHARRAPTRPTSRSTPRPLGSLLPDLDRPAIEDGLAEAHNLNFPALGSSVVTCGRRRIAQAGMPSRMMPIPARDCTRLW